RGNTCQRSAGHHPLAVRVSCSICPLGPTVTIRGNYPFPFWRQRLQHGSRVNGGELPRRYWSSPPFVHPLARIADGVYTDTFAFHLACRRTGRYLLARFPQLRTCAL